jgi:hypothetical protein
MMFTTDPIERTRALLAAMEKQKKDELARQAKALAPPSGFRARMEAIFQPGKKERQMILDALTRLETAVGKLLSQPPVTVADPNAAAAETRISDLATQVEAKLLKSQTTSTTASAPGGQSL